MKTKKNVMVSIAIVALALAAVMGGHAATSKDAYQLKGEVYPNFKIEMQTRAGRPVKVIKAGTYRLKIEDKSSVHDFHLTGPGVNRSTTVGGMSETTWTVRLKPGTYTYYCDPHAGQMRGSFRVSA
jgi:plastocyanin